MDREEIEHLNVIQVAILLHKTPEEVRGMAKADIAAVLAVNQANNKIQAQRFKR